MAGQSPDYEKLFLEERCKREAAEHAQKEAEHAQERAEERTRNTTLPEFLDACHNYLHCSLTVQTNPNLSTQGDPANANNKLRPERLVIWEDFPARQAAIWDDIMESEFPLERHFTRLVSLEDFGETIRRRMMSSELDLNVFQRCTVEDHVSAIVERLHGSRTLQRKFGLQGAVQFENHGNTLSPESQREHGMEQVPGTGQRQSQRLQAKAAEANRSRGPTEPAAATPAVTAPSRPRADQFCVYNTSTQNTENRTAAFIVEYKAPHKLPLGYIYEGLEDMELEDVIQCRKTDSSLVRFRRLIAAVITQAFSYMVTIGVEYGCVCTGEASIFLRVPEDPRTVHYYLSIPKGDVGERTGWTPNMDGANRLHLTAVGQMVAFTLQALKTPPRSQTWRVEAAARLKSWEVAYEDLLESAPPTPSSEYRPPRHKQFFRMSPVQLRQRPAPSGVPHCRSPEEKHGPSDDESDPDTPSRQPSAPQRPPRTQPAGNSSSNRNPRGGTESGNYCTQECLLGLVRGGPLDKSCPNWRDHGKSRHGIDRSTFLILIREQLSKDLDTDCKPVCRPGACGVLFRVRLRSHGYTVAAKATPIDFVHRIRREGTIYEHLRPIQGIHVPVYLGNIDLKTRYFYEGICELIHMMFLSFGGKCISTPLTSENRTSITQQVDSSARAIHDLGVLHNDLEPRNLLWNDETGQVMVVDFERAEVVKPRCVLRAISANRKGKSESDAKQGGNRCVFASERDRVAYALGV